MATLINETSGIEVILQPQHVIGRHPTAATCLTNMEASRTHAVVIWDGEHWLLQDTSSNGTFINGQPLFKGRKAVLHIGDNIQFGSMMAESWFVKDLSSPVCLLQPITPGLSTILLEGIIGLPSEDCPDVSIYKSEQGQWICESDFGEIELAMGDVVGSRDGQSQWRFIDAKASILTDIIGVDNSNYEGPVSFIFDVSQNEEHVSLKICVGQSMVDLGERNHHYLLLLLARKFQEDKDAGLSSQECGWLDKGLLCRMLGQSESHLNIQVYRFRKQFIDSYPDPDRVPKVIERRSGELRFVSDDVKINGGIAINTEHKGMAIEPILN